MITADDRLIVVLARDALDLWDDLRRAYLARRPTHLDPMLGSYPLTTNGDVVQVVDVLGQIFRRDYVPAKDGALAADWRLIQDRIRARIGAADALYPDNAGLWLRDLFGIARRLGPMFTEPKSRAEQIADVTKDAVLGPTKIVADVAVGATKIAGNAIGSIGSGLWDSLKVPLLVGGGLVAAVFLLPRVWRAPDSAHSKER